MGSKSRIVESIPAAAALLGCEPELVKRAKRLGCPAFKPGNRIAVEELRKWIAGNADELKATGDNVSLKDQKLNEEIRKLRIANDRADKLVVNKQAVKGVINACVERIRHFLEQKLENEYPSAVAGMDVPQARVYGRRVHDQIILEHQKMAEEWEKI
jgi:predicted transcriptional regulator